MHLTARSMLLAAAIAVLGILGVWSPALNGLWRLPAAFAVLALTYEWLRTRLRPVELSLQLAPSVYLGRGAPLRLLWRAGAAGIGRVRFLLRAPAGLQTGADVREVRLRDGLGESELALLPVALGRWPWPAQRARVLGPLGLAWWSRRLPVALETRVLPDTLGVVRRAAGSTVHGAALRAVVGAGHEIHALRDYRPGDPPHAIDWKASARVGELITREFSEDQHLEIVVAVDAGRSSGLAVDSLSRLGHYVNLAARFAELATGQDDRVGLLVFADRTIAALPPGRGAAAVVRIREVLAGLAPQAAESNPLSAVQQLRRLVRHRSLVVLLTELDDNTAASQLAQCVRLLMPKHAPLIAGLLSDEARALAERPARHWLDPYVSLAAQEHTAAIRANIRRLQRMGAQVVAARPGDLQRAVFDRYRAMRDRRRI